jgi:hypothetical protein
MQVFKKNQTYTYKGSDTNSLPKIEIDFVSFRERQAIQDFTSNATVILVCDTLVYFNQRTVFLSAVFHANWR